jgi:prepilin peptidase CpaA
MDWRWRRIPNWLTLSGLALGLASNSALGGWHGLRTSLLGALLGLAGLLPLVLLRSLGAGDWKLVGALGACVGPSALLDVLVLAIIAAGLMAAVVIIHQGRVAQTLRNIIHLFKALATLHPPPPEVSLDNPGSLKVPFGVAVAVAAILISGRHLWAGF